MSELLDQPEEEPSAPKPPNSREIQAHLFNIWFKATVVNGAKRSNYKVPFRIEALPCGCDRGASNEADTNNTWHIKRKGEDLSHKECGQKLN